MRVGYFVFAAAAAVVAHPDHTRHNCCVQYDEGGPWFYDQDLTGTVDSGTCLQKPGISIDGSEFDSYCQIEAYDHMGYIVAFS
ncbi:hypothetical protein CGCS363_v004215 [Colletotrichum siamense]|uniref:uncharacterized protein n=1 Tax=Colletotrichum siamense TaxID=690259 RepID=UPI001872D373|nr:uncharacterized protein CGCS363_v004215 [Colletotrichum siamense]KAF5506404.1 hypothetical protein CGCS363_v004215 [Colletotrichum siamense]